MYVPASPYVKELLNVISMKLTVRLLSEKTDIMMIHVTIKRILSKENNCNSQF